MILDGFHSSSASSDVNSCMIEIHNEKNTWPDFLLQYDVSQNMNMCRTRDRKKRNIVLWVAEICNWLLAVCPLWCCGISLSFFTLGSNHVFSGRPADVCSQSSHTVSLYYAWTVSSYFVTLYDIMEGNENPRNLKLVQKHVPSTSWKWCLTFVSTETTIGRNLNQTFTYPIKYLNIY